MENPDWLKLCSKQFQAAIDMVQLHAGDATVFIVFVEDIPENFLQPFSGGDMRIQGDAVGMPEAQRTHIIKAKNMIGMSMGINNCIQPRDALANGLLAEIRRGINEHAAVSILQHDRGPGAAVLWLN